jgi:septal ring factor EnvC (AmiA/AmiB activator)
MNSGINITNIVEIFGFLAMMVGIYNRMTVKLKEQEMKIQALEHRLVRAEQEDHHLYKKLDEIMKMLTDIKIELKEKQDRD